MIMRARHEGSALVLDLEGHLDFETTQQFQQTCGTLIKKSGGQVVFNLEKLKFVGSSGINQFILVLKELNGAEVKPRLCRLSSEFSKVFKAYQTTRNPFEIFEDESQAIESFTKPSPAPKKVAKKKTSRSN